MQFHFKWFHSDVWWIFYDFSDKNTLRRYSYISWKFIDNFGPNEYKQRI